jgi:hypothetical protein
MSEIEAKMLLKVAATCVVAFLLTFVVLRKLG